MSRIYIRRRANSLACSYNEEQAGGALARNPDAFADASDPPYTPTARRGERADTEGVDLASPSALRRSNRLRPFYEVREVEPASAIKRTHQTRVLVTTVRESVRERLLLIQLSSSFDRSEGSTGGVSGLSTPSSEVCECAADNFPPANATDDISDPLHSPESADNFAPDVPTETTPTRAHRRKQSRPTRCPAM